MVQPVRVRRLTEQEGQKLQRIVRRGSTSTVRFRRAMMLLASAGGNSVPVIARLVQADEDTVRDVIHRFNEIGLACLDPRWVGGRPRLLSDDDEDFVIQTATTRPVKLGQPFTRWSVRKPSEHLRRNVARPIRIGREAMRCLLQRRGVTFQRTKTWKESHLDEFGPLGIRPTAGLCWAKQGKPDRLPATHHRTHGVRYFHGCYSVGDDTLWGVNRRRKGTDHSLAVLKSIRAARPDGAPTYVILDNLSAHKGSKIRRWAARNKVELCFTPTNASWANPVEAHFGPLRQFTLANSKPPQPPSPDRRAASLLALAQPERTPSWRPGRAAPGTRPCPQRERHPLGRPPSQPSGLTARPVIVGGPAERPHPGNEPRQGVSGLRARRQACGLFTRPPGSCSSLAVTTSPAWSSRSTMRSRGRRYDS